MREVNWEGKMILKAIPESWRELFSAVLGGEGTSHIFFLSLFPRVI